jgi:hypothetical protein
VGPERPTRYRSDQVDQAVHGNCDTSQNGQPGRPSIGHANGTADAEGGERDVEKVQGFVEPVTA